MMGDSEGCARHSERSQKDHWDPVHDSSCHGLTEERLLANQGASFWLQQAIRNTKNRDPVDVLNDLHLLHAVVQERLAKALEKATQAGAQNASNPISEAV